MFLHIFLLVSALCLDTFVASAAYGTNQVRLSWKQILAVNGICSLCLGISLLFGNLLDRIIPETFTREICFFSLLFLGCLKLTDSILRFHSYVSSLIFTAILWRQMPTRVTACPGRRSSSFPLLCLLTVS